MAKRNAEQESRTFGRIFYKKITLNHRNNLYCQFHFSKKAFVFKLKNLEVLESLAFVFKFRGRRLLVGSFQIEDDDGYEDFI